MNEITKRTIDEYKNYLIEEEKCSVTIEKYIRDITAFVNWTEGNEITKALVLEYKSMLTQQYAPASVNSVLSSLNGYFNYIERYDLKVKNLKVQRQIFCQSICSGTETAPEPKSCICQARRYTAPSGRMERRS